MSTELVKIGACSVSFDGVDMGYTTGGVQLRVSMNVEENSLLDKPPSSYDPIAVGYSVEAVCPFAETALATLSPMTPGSTTAGNTLTLKNVVGTRLRQHARPLVLTTLDGSQIITLPLAIPIVEANYSFTLNNVRVSNVRFMGLYDDNDDILKIQFL